MNKVLITFSRAPSLSLVYSCRNTISSQPVGCCEDCFTLLKRQLSRMSIQLPLTTALDLFQNDIHFILFIRLFQHTNLRTIVSWYVCVQAHACVHCTLYKERERAMMFKK